MSQGLFSVSIVSLPLNFTILLHPESADSLGVSEKGYALVKGVNGQIAVVKVIRDQECPKDSTRITHSMQLTLAVSPGDSIPILPYESDSRCEAIQIAPLFDGNEEDFKQTVKHYFSADKRPISIDSIFTLRVGSQERAFKIIGCLPADRSFSNKSTKLYFAQQPGPLLPKPSLPKQLSNLVIDNDIVQFIKNRIYYPSIKINILKALNIPTSYGILIEGPSGSGKTSLLSAISNTINVPSVYCQAERLKKLDATEFNEKLNQIFGFTAEKEQCLIMFDNLDSVLSSFNSAKRSYEKKKLATFFNLLDFVMQRSGIFVIATVSSIQNIDASLVRDKRFGLTIKLSNPSLDQRKELIRMYTAGMKIDDDDLDEIGDKIDESASAKEIENICRLAVASLIEDVTGAQGSDISDSLAVYALNTKIKSMYFGFGGRRRRHHGEGGRRRRHHRRDDDEDDDDDNSYRRRQHRSRRRGDSDDDEENEPFSRRNTSNTRRRRRNDSDEDSDDNQNRSRRHRSRRRDDDDDSDEDNFPRRRQRNYRNNNDDEDDNSQNQRRRRRVVNDDDDDEEEPEVRRPRRRQNNSSEDEDLQPRRRSQRHNDRRQNAPESDSEDDPQTKRRPPRSNKRRQRPSDSDDDDDDEPPIRKSNERRRRMDDDDDEHTYSRRQNRRQNKDDSDEEPPTTQQKRRQIRAQKDDDSDEDDYRPVVNRRRNPFG